MVRARSTMKLPQGDITQDLVKMPEEMTNADRLKEVIELLSRALDDCRRALGDIEKSEKGDMSRAPDPD